MSSDPFDLMTDVKIGEVNDELKVLNRIYIIRLEKPYGYRRFVVGISRS
jgi:hypothetical protein